MYIYKHAVIRFTYDMKINDVIKPTHSLRGITGNLKAAFACQLGFQYNIRSNWQMKRNENEGTVPPGAVLDGSVFEKRCCWNSWVFPCKCWECLWLYSGIWGYHGGIKNYVKTPWLLFTQKVASVKDFYTLLNGGFHLCEDSFCRKISCYRGQTWHVCGLSF